MARRSRRKASTSITVGLGGTGKIAAKAMKKHLSDFIEAQDGPITWVLPGSTAVTKSLQSVIDFLYDEDATYGLVADEDFEDEALEEGAEFVEEVSTAAELVLVEENLAQAEGEKFYVLLLDENSDADIDLLEAASKAGVKTLDLCAGLQEVTFAVEDDDEPEESDDEASEDGDSDDEASEDTPTIALPDEAAELIDAGDADGAIAFLKELDRDFLADLADELDVEVPKGTHRKTIAGDIVGMVMGGMAEAVPESEAEEAEEAPEPEEKPKRAKKSSKAKAKKEPEPEPDVEPATKDAAIAAKDPETSAVLASRPRFDYTHYISVLAGIASAKDVKTAEEFHAFITDQGLLG